MKQDKQVLRFYSIVFLENLNFTLPVWILYGLQYLGLSNWQSVFLGTFGYLVSNFFEIPTGYISDKYGRKFSYIAGSAIVALTTLSYVFIKDFYLLLIIQFIAGIALSMTSGSLDALMFEYLKANDSDKEYDRIVSNQYSLLFAGRIISSTLGGVLFLSDPRFPFIALCVGTIVAGLLSFGLKESRHIKPQNEELQINTGYFQNIFKFNILFFLSLVFLVSFSLDAVFFSYQQLFDSMSLSAVFIGLIFSAISVFSLIGSQLNKFLLKRFTSRFVLKIVLLSGILLSTCLYTQNLTLVLLVMVPFSTLSGAVMPAILSFIQKRTEDKFRNSVISTSTFIEGIGSILGGIYTGAMLDIFDFESLYLSIVVIASLTLIAFIFVSIVYKNQLKAT